MTKKSTDTTTDPTAAEHERTLAEVAAREVDLAAAQAVLVEKQDHREELDDRLSRGDHSVSSEDLMLASFDVERASRLVSAAEQALAKAKRAVVNVDTELAEALAPTVAAVLGVPVTTTTLVPTSSPEELPAAVLVQRKRSVADSIKGTISGDLDLYFYRSALHRDLNADAIDRAAAKTSVQLRTTPQGTREVDGRFTDTAQLVIGLAYAEAPVIRDLPESWPEVHFSQGLAAEVRRIGGSWHGTTTGVVMGHSGVAGGRASVVGSVTPNGSNLSWSSDRTDTKGIRHRTLVVPVSYWGMRGLVLTPGELAEQVERLLFGYKGTAVASLGRVTDVTLQHNPPANGKHVITASFTFASRLPGGAVAPTAPTVPAQRRTSPLDPALPARHPGQR